MTEESLTRLFGLILFRVRNWSALKSARVFSKDDIDVFKGVNPNARDVLPFADVCRLAHFCLDEFNRSAQGLVRGEMDFPFQLDQVIMNGRRFFEMVKHYAEKSKEIGLVLKSNAKEIYVAVSTYDGRGRTGDRYVRNLFDCMCLYYWDKFGETKELTKAILAYEQYAPNRSLESVATGGGWTECNEGSLKMVLGGTTGDNGERIPVLFNAALTGGRMLDPWGRPYELMIDKTATLSGGGDEEDRSTRFLYAPHLPNFWRLTDAERGLQ